jgi:hypothetical protein
MDCFWGLVVRLVLPFTLLVVSIVVLHKLAWILQIIRTDVNDVRAKAILTVLVIGLMLLVVIFDWFNVEMLISRLHDNPCINSTLLTHNENDSVAVPVDEFYENEQRRRLNHAPGSCICRFCHRNLLLLMPPCSRVLEWLSFRVFQPASKKLYPLRARVQLCNARTLLATA